VRIDVHAHHFPAEYIDCLARLSGSEESALRDRRDRMTLDEQVDLLGTVGIELQVLSAGPVVPYLLNATDAVAAARLGNDIFADVCRDYGGRFAAFGSVPLPHVDEAIVEVERCLDTLGMLGITVGCSVAGRSLDEPAFHPFFGELDRRKAVLFLHPVGAGAGPGTADYGLAWMVGAPFEDTVAGLRLVLSGLTMRYPNIRIIVPHLGGTLPFLLERLDYITQHQQSIGAAAGFIEDMPSTYVRRLWFDTVNLHPAALRCACDSFGPQRLLLGTDFPYLLGTNFKRCITYIEEAGLPPEQAAAILDQNAQLFFGLS
jgi:6-methylsalicylate decarboxylase